MTRAQGTPEPESVTARTIREIRREAWQQGHDAACFGFAATVCAHQNPYEVL